MSGVIGILIGLALGVIVHEAGHFICAAPGRISIAVVSVGLGPVILRGRLGETDLVLRALPIAGFAAPVTYNNIGKPWIVLFLLGGEAGRALLQELAAANNGRAIDVAMTTIFLALAEQGLGNSPAARRLLTDARRMVEADSVLAFLHPLTERTAGALGASQN